MKIMIVLPYIPYPVNNGGRIRSYNLVAHLSLNHDVTVVSLNRDLKKNQVTDASRELNRIGVTDFYYFRPDFLIGGFLRNKHFSILLARYFSTKIQKFIYKNVERFDAIIFDGLYSFVNNPRFTNRDSDKKIILCEQNIEYDLLQQRKKSSAFPLSVGLNYEAYRIRRFESRSLQNASSVFCVSDTDKEKIKSITLTKNIFVAPNGVDIKQLTFRKISENNKLVFVGSGLYWPNIDAIHYFFREIATKIYNNFPYLKISIIGRELNPNAFIKYKNPKLEVNYYSNVPDIRPYIYDAAIFLVPLRYGSGTRIKILEAMALGCPIISTSIGVEGIDGLINGENFLLANTPTEFLDGILNILNNKKLAMQIAINARSLIEKHYTWDRTLKSIDDQLEKIDDH
jgi:polysaccharide biosynthesis protein PslH